MVYDHPTVTLESLATKPRWTKSTHEPLDGDAGLPIERLTSQDIQMAEEFLSRRQDFVGSLATREAVARRIAQALLKRMEIDASQMGVKSNDDLILKVVQLYRNQED